MNNLQQTNGRGERAHPSAAAPVKLGGTWRRLAVRDDAVIKTQEPNASRQERRRTLAGARVGQRTGLFAVPSILAFDDSTGDIVFERLPLVGFRHALSDGSRSFELVERAAAALVAIHDQMVIGVDGTRVPAKLLGDVETALVPMHGDFSVSNLLLDTRSDRLVIIDWANADWLGLQADLAPAEFDLAVFLISLFHRRAFGPFRVARRREVAGHFLATYAAAASRPLNLPLLRTLAGGLAPLHYNVTRRQRGEIRAIGYRHGMIDLSWFLQRLSRRGVADVSSKPAGEHGSSLGHP